MKSEKDLDWGTLAGRLAWLFEQEGYGSKAAAARRGDFRQSDLSRWLGGMIPSEPNMRKLEKAFPDVRKEWLWHGEGDPYSNGLSSNRVKESQTLYAAPDEMRILVSDLRGLGPPGEEVEAKRRLLRAHVERVQAARRKLPDWLQEVWNRVEDGEL